MQTTIKPGETTPDNKLSLLTARHAPSAVEQTTKWTAPERSTISSPSNRQNWLRCFEVSCGAANIGRVVDRSGPLVTPKSSLGGSRISTCQAARNCRGSVETEQSAADFLKRAAGRLSSSIWHWRYSRLASEPNSPANQSRFCELPLSRNETATAISQTVVRSAVHRLDGSDPCADRHRAAAAPTIRWLYDV